MSLPIADTNGTSGVLHTGGQVNWLYCTLSNFGTSIIDPQHTIDVLALSPEINLYEDILSPTIYGNMVIVDTHNLISRLPIIGLETLFLGFQTPGFENTIEKAFKVFKITDRTIIGNKQTYKLHFISNDAFADVRNTINKAYHGTSGQIIAQILTDTQNWDTYDQVSSANVAIPPNSGGPGKTYWELDTSYNNDSGQQGTIDAIQDNQLKFVSPQWSTFECIKWCEKMAVRKIDGLNTPVADFLFYETSQAYYFWSLSDLFQCDPIDFVKYDHSQSNGNAAEMMTKIIELRHRKINDNLTNFLNKAYGQTTYQNDMFLKTLQDPSTTKWTYHDTYLYNKYSAVSVTGNQGEAIIPEYPAALMNNNSSTQYNIADDSNISVTNMNRLTHDLPDDYEKFATLSRLPAINFLEMNQIDIDIWGRTWLEVGDMINIVQGNYTQDNDQSGLSLNTDNPNETANWLVIAIHHQLAPAQHKMTLQCVRNATEKAVVPLSV